MKIKELYQLKEMLADLCGELDEYGIDCLMSIFNKSRYFIESYIDELIKTKISEGEKK